MRLVHPSARAGVALAALVVALAGGLGCPSDPAFQASDTAVTDTGTDTDTSVADDSDTGEVDALPCVPTCASDMTVGACGDDGCGGSCACAAASECDGDQLCGCLVGCEVTVTTGSIGPLAAAVDARGRPLVAGFRDPFPAQHDLVFGAYEGTLLVQDSVREDVGLPYGIALAMTSGDAPIILYTDDTPGTVMRVTWARQVGGEWVTAPFLDVADGSRPSLERSLDGTVVGAITDREAFAERFARFDEVLGDWVDLATLEGVGGESEGIAIVMPLDWTLDDRDRPHVAYFCCGLQSELVYAHWTGASWASQSLGVQPRVSGSNRRVAIGLDRDSHPHILHQSADSDVPTLVHRWWDGSVWRDEEVDRAEVGAEIGQALVLVPDSKRNFHVVYSKAGRLDYRKLFTTDWTEAVGAAGLYDAERAFDLAVDAADVPHVVFADAVGQVRWWTPPDLHP